MSVAPIRYLTLSLLLLCVAGEAPAQAVQKYWLEFRDKPAAVEVGSARAISPHARKRRALRGTTDGAWLDQPVSGVYLDRLRAAGIEPIVTSRWLNAVSVRLSEDELAEVRRLDFVQEIRRVARAVRPPPPRPAPQPREEAWKSSTLSFGPSRAQLEAINAIELIESGINGTGVRLGFLDTPFGEFEHEAFDDLRQENRLAEIQDFVGKPQAQFTHGMSVASVAAGFAEGHLIGPAHGAEILAAITEYVPTETNQEEDAFVAGLEWLEAQGVDVVNVSLGYTTFDEGEHSYTIEDLDGDTGITTRAADHAASLGVVVVSSAGNEACSSPDDCWYYIGTPADGDSIIAVGAVTANSVRSGFSSFGPTADYRFKPDVAAPGSSVHVAVPGGYASLNGTSFASPLVAGVVCQMLQVNPNLKPMDVLQILRATASQSQNPDNSLGWGIVNAERAVDAAVAGTPPQAPVTAQAYPNPATDFVFIHINAPGAAKADLSIYDVVGRRVFQTSETTTSQGGPPLRVPTHRLSPGLYMYRIHRQGETATGTFIVMR